ncbi:amyloid beta a4 precursor protein-binding family b member 2-like protein [Dermatophagoides farinae]|uniref:Amyloid beta a4 protein-binding family b member 2-like protein n=2 Tax=Dermatophagoides farinae TaxID=6954 RepID=A0A9D4SKQ0_DERFA|nr:amyloid beta a4 precursor protein-binding family b member 2-like protein [Dermatophagoides farinae]
MMADTDQFANESITNVDKLISNQQQQQHSKNQSNDSKKSQTSIDLPDGWERHEDELGSYFWHIPTGTIQRERPYLNTIDKSMIRRWLDVDESQINSQTGSMVIKRCIYELSTRAENAARCWGPSDTQSLILKINNERISLLEPNTSTTLTVQLIREIRMWAVDDNNNFAYVVKDRKSGKPGTVKCHIFHCDDDQQQQQQQQENNCGTTQTQQQQQQTAQRLALYLKDALVRIKNHQQNRNERRPNDLLLKSNNNNSITMMDNFEFPTPIEEPKKCIQALYIGFIPVTKPMGVDILNMAIEEIINSLKMSLTNENHDEIELMRPVLVNISPSNIVVECQETGATLVECRVRYLSFLGISLDNVKRCGFIMQVNEKEFVCHCFQVEPSAGALCKIIEAACKLRYQKCLDAHSNKQQPKQNNNSVATSKSTTTTTTTTTTTNSSPVAALKSSISGVFSKILNKTSTATTTSHQ